VQQWVGWCAILSENFWLEEWVDNCVHVSFCVDWWLIWRTIITALIASEKLSYLEFG